ncbi:pirin family protein [Chitinophaga rhizophila]|uniref:Pirin family protein n=1 Tax=Chitinophaga rhizophila TaxID=2866212 RepID=A0ABS7G6E3_9BACT|nr:pirin family protein [Chitinophaga rhizophila]MBW8682730.1 pirin family protein [Chitinophaga rhizophila]
MAKTILHKAATRGHANHGWLDSHHTFSFANYYNPERMQFGALRVLNDDIVAGSRGFDSHPHDNMEIISIPLEGALEHKDNLGNTVITKAGEIQVMSTGTGVFHSEYNANADKHASFLQIWLFPNQLNVAPRYDQATINIRERKNSLQQLISPDRNGEGTWIYQDAWFHMGRFDKNTSTEYAVRKQGNGVYLFVISGAFSVNGQLLESRDGYGIQDEQQFNITALEDNAEILVIDIPMFS